MQLIPLPGSAPPDSELGLLQRGRGAGWLAATTSPDGVEHLLHCVTNDPRWDTQVEWRGDYLATLALRLDVDPAVIAKVARASDAEDYLPRDVLKKVSRRGSASAPDAIASLPAPDDDPPPTVADRPPCPPMEAPVVDLVRKIRPRCRLKFTNRFVATTDNLRARTRPTRRARSPPPRRNMLDHIHGRPCSWMCSVVLRHLIVRGSSCPPAHG